MESLPQSALLEDGQSMLVYANPGMGKSELMRFVAASLAKSWIDGEGDRVPVLLEARGWSRQYSSLVEGVARELFGCTTEALMSFIRDNPALFCLIMDGLDEARSDRDLLFSELACYASLRRVGLSVPHALKETASESGLMAHPCRASPKKRSSRISAMEA